MGKKSAPATPDLPDVSEMLKTQANLNRMDSHNPFKSVLYDKDPNGNGWGQEKWTVKEELTDLGQDLTNRMVGMAVQDPAIRESTSMSGTKEALAQALGNIGANNVSFEQNAPASPSTPERPFLGGDVPSNTPTLPQLPNLPNNPGSPFAQQTPHRPILDNSENGFRTHVKIPSQPSERIAKTDHTLFNNPMLKINKGDSFENWAASKAKEHGWAPTMVERLRQGFDKKGVFQ